jgi:hypothetical protein
MAVTAGSRKPVLLAPVHCAPKALSSPSTSNCPSLHHRERGSPMKNRKREICTSGSVRDEDGQPPHLLGRRDFLHLAAGAAALPVVSQMARAQAYPTRPVRIMVGFAADGATDIVARIIGQWLSERLGQLLPLRQMQQECCRVRQLLLPDGLPDRPLASAIDCFGLLPTGIRWLRCVLPRIRLRLTLRERPVDGPQTSQTIRGRGILSPA